MADPTQVQDYLAQKHRESGWTRFWAQGIANALEIDLGVAMSQLRTMQKQGKVLVLANVTTQSGRVVWRGPEKDLRAARKTTYNFEHQTTPADPLEDEVALEFNVSPAWLRELDAVQR